ncbi:uncharacterized protein LOC133795647 [Humulus lupulus]|uniref:uncharacterized protein LOC133795647 n=1 Tax=Humulus lupulus TaxID=3486 RepID=UPI002B410D65|nr:uncharacterized protein LOC133795647 [Humulus lupulus]
MTNLPTDPGLRPPISNYHPNIQDEIRRHYLQQGPCQSRSHEFPKKFYGAKECRFNIAWFDQFSTWLEYNISKNSSFCLCCYLFKSSIGKQAGGNTFVSKDFSNWMKMSLLEAHVGNHNSSHYKCYKKCEALMDGKQQIEHIFLKKNIKDRISYRVRLIASNDCICFLVRQGLAFRGHDESQESNNQGNFLELLAFLANHNEEVRVVALKNAHENLKLTSPKIQKDIVNACAMETINVIIRDIGDVVFSILVDESRDVSIKEQMVVMFRYVDKRGCVIERFIGIEHVPNTTTISLKIAIDKLFSKHGLSISKLRGQWYDGASNMSGEFNGLKSIIMMENGCAFFVHCFAHQLQFALLDVAKKHDLIGTFFTVVSNVVNIVGASSKHRDILREKQALKVIEASKGGELLSGRCQNQESGIKRPCDTRWGSHFGTLVSFTIMFSSIIDVLEEITNDRLNSEQKYEASIVLQMVQTYDFVFNLNLVKNILGIINELSQVLQKGKVNPSLAQLYPYDFSTMDIKVLEYQLQTYVDDMRSHVKFSALKGMVDLSKKLVETKKDKVYPLVYLLIKLALTLLVATSSVKRAFSAMNIVKNQMRNKIGDQWLNDSLIVYLENDVFNAIDNEPIIHRFQTHEIPSRTTLNVRAEKLIHYAKISRQCVLFLSNA